ncbi:MAG TPA: TraB/GumN family protein [Usitatibacter sp.]|nr:TraB/GumN family protein [Usitatibacter sp.]
MLSLLRHAARALLCAATLLSPIAAAQDAQRNFLWEVISLKNRVYLFGTVHAGKKGWYPLPAPVEEAFLDSKVLVVEADITDVDAIAKSGPILTYTPPDSLAKHVEPEHYDRFRKLLGRYQVPEEQAARMKPFMAVSLLVFAEWGRLGYLPQYGVDAYLIAKARAENKRILEIEGLQVQTQLIESLGEKESKVLFEGTLTALESGLTSEQITGMVNAWQSGDPKLLLEIARKYNESVPGAREFEEKFIWSRHDAMVEKIEGYLQTGARHFVAVGALHLAGPRGLVELLRKKGYIVRQR